MFFVQINCKLPFWENACSCSSTSWMWRWSHVGRKQETFANAWPKGCSSTLQSYNPTAATWPWTPTSRWPSTPPLSFSRASLHMWCSMNCCTPPAATWETCVWWMLTGCWKQHQSTLAASCTPPRANQYSNRTDVNLLKDANTGKCKTIIIEFWHSMISYRNKWGVNFFFLENFSGFHYLPVHMHLAVLLQQESAYWGLTTLTQILLTAFLLSWRYSIVPFSHMFNTWTADSFCFSSFNICMHFNCTGNHTEM